MQFPIYTLPNLGAGSIIAIIATIHVIISHGAAMGGSIYISSLEYYAYKKGYKDVDEFAKKFLFIIMIVTTTVGALTGVGIWFSTMTVQPNAIGSLLRVYFWAWFTEWLVFIAEVVLLLVYYFTWNKMKGEKKRKHIKIGFSFAVMSWLTAAIITGVLGGMLTPGAWLETRTFWDAFANPTWLPQLFFRTFIAIAMISAFGYLYSQILIKERDTYNKVIKYTGRLCLFAAIMLFPSGWWYLNNIPPEARDLIVWSTGLTGKVNLFLLLNIIGIAVIILIALWSLAKPARFPKIIGILPFIIGVAYIGEFEMIRENIRKPFVISGYMYANGIRVEDQDKFNREGILPNSNFLGVKEVTPQNQVEAGRAIFKAECMACHTVNGWRDQRNMSKRIAGWPEDAIYDYVGNLHKNRPFMPPFVGTDEERRALAKYLAQIASTPQTAAMGDKESQEKEGNVNAELTSTK